MLKVSGISKSFGSKVAVDNVYFQVERGEVVALLGANGAGKTTIMRIISTLMKPDSGTVTVNGYDIGENPERVRKEIAILFGGEVGLYEKLTGRENIRYFAGLYGMDKKDIEGRVDELSQSFQMSEFVDKKVSAYSRGMKQKISFARAVVHSPSIIILDEPATGLDVSSSRTIQEFIGKCRNEGKAVLFSSHSMTEVEKLCDRVIIVNEGKLIYNSTIGAMKEKYKEEYFDDIFLRVIGGDIL